MLGVVRTAKRTKLNICQVGVSFVPCLATGLAVAPIFRIAIPARRFTMIRLGTAKARWRSSVEGGRSDGPSDEARTAGSQQDQHARGMGGQVLDPRARHLQGGVA